MDRTAANARSIRPDSHSKHQLKRSISLTAANEN